MRYFIDTEFSERGPAHPIELISIGIIAEDGRTFYGVNRDFNPAHANEWVRENVLLLLPPQPSAAFPYHGKAWMPYDRIRAEVLTFVGDDPEPEFWGYYCAFDYVILSQLMGGIEGWPRGWPYLMRDLRQWLDHEGLQHIEQDDGDPHDALQDALWVRNTFAAHHHHPKEATP